MVLISQDHDVQFQAGDIGELDSSRETLISLGIVVLQANLQFHSFGELAGLALRLLQHLNDLTADLFRLQLAAVG